MNNVVVYWLMLVYLLSGACSLIDQVVWLRLLKLSLGNTVYASCVVVSVFMAGLALGALLMGRFSDRIEHRLKLYAFIEVLITIVAVCSPWMLQLADEFYVWLYRAWQPTHGVILLVQVVVSAAILLLPTVLMGTTLPLLSRFVTSIEAESGRLVGRLYALNTLGAAAGCFLAGFLLIRTIGVMGTLYTAAALNLLVAAGGFTLHLVSRKDAVEASETRGADPASKRVVNTGFVLLGIGFFLSGLLSIGYELLWMRSVVFSMGAYTYVFSAILTVYLVGNVVGVGIGARIVPRLKNPAAGFAVTLSLLGLCGVLYAPWLNFCVHSFPPAAWNWSDPYGLMVGLPPMLSRPLIQNLLLCLVPSVLMGVGFPMALQAWVNHAGRIGWSTGTAYGTNTVGAVIGGILTGFVLIPALGMQRSIILLGVVGVWAAAALWLRFPGRRHAAVRFALPGIAAVVTVIGFVTPPDLYARVIAATIYMEDCDLVDVKEGIVTTASLHQNRKTGARFLCTSGNRVAGDSNCYRADQKMLGHLPVLLNKDARSVLSVGFGSGESTACLSFHGIERIACVEIAPEVLEFSLKYFNHINLGDQLHDKVDMIIMDAKNYLHLTETRYDAIVNDCTSTRNFAENASLFTREYFENARHRLNEGGLFMSWMDGHGTEAEPVQHSIMGTMMEVFPYVTLWYPMTDPGSFFVIVGSLSPQRVPLAHLELELTRPQVANSLAEINIRNAVDLLTCYVGDEQDLKRVITDHRTNSDYFPFVEFYQGESPAGKEAMRTFLQSVRSGSIERHIDWGEMPPSQQDEWLSRLRAASKVSDQILLAATAQTYAERIELAIAGLADAPDNVTLLELRSDAETQLLSRAFERLEQGDHLTAVKTLRRLRDIAPESAAVKTLRARIGAAGHSE